MYYLLYTLFGRNTETYKSELIYSLLSFNKVAGDWSKQNIRVLIYTNTRFSLPEQLNHLSIEFNLLQEEEINAWIRKGNGHALILKPGIMLNSLQEYKSNVILVDTDTFFYKDPESILRKINDGYLFLHLKEYAINKRPKIYSYFQTRQFKQVNGNQYTISPDFYMWNSGVIGMGAQYTYLLAEIVYLIEQISFENDWTQREARLIEQTAFSYVLQNQPHTLLSSEESILHYWFFKEARFLLGCHFNFFYGLDQELFTKILEHYHLRPELLYSLPHAALPSVIIKLMKKYAPIEEYHFESLPADTFIGKLLRGVRYEAQKG